MTNQEDRKVIVIGEQHYTPLGVIRTLGEAGIHPIAIIVNNNETETASSSKYISKLHLVSDYEAAFNILCEKYGSERNKPIVIPCDDIIVKLIDKSYNELRNLFIVNNANKQGQISYYQDKDNLYRLAEKNGLEIPKTWQLRTDGIDIPKDITYPVITKPRSSYAHWKNDYHICDNEAQLLEALQSIREHTDSVLIQQYIRKVTERTLEGASINNGKDVICTIMTRYTYTLPDYYSMKMTVSEPNQPDIERAVGKTLYDIEYEGIFEAEFMEDEDGKLWFLEINFRNSTWSYASTKLKMPLPIIWMNGMLNGAFKPQCEKAVPEGYTALAEIPDFGQRVIRFKMISPLTWIKEAVRVDCLYFFNLKDMKPVFSNIRYFINRAIKHTAS